MLSFFKRLSGGSKDELNVPQCSGTEITQFVSKVVNFSSQYGTAGSRSYAACNLEGPRQVMDRYGDFVDAFVLRTYGSWWQRCPSAPRKLKKAASNFHSEDFVEQLSREEAAQAMDVGLKYSDYKDYELEYDTAVIPTGITIYETYNPGTVVRILACNGQPNVDTSMDLPFKVEAKDLRENAGSQEIADTPGKVEWVTLWSGKPQCSEIPKQVRRFSPELKRISFPTRLIRLEFNSVDCDYYTELDAVELFGIKPEKGEGQMRDRAKGFQLALTTRLLRQMSLAERQTSVTSQDDEDFDKWGAFALLPDEVIQLIMSYLDMVSLTNVAQTCSLLLKNAYDPLLYAELDLQSRWNTVDDVALESLVSRCSSLQHLNLSWTGGGGQITEQAVCSFLKECGAELRTLRLACCQYVHEETIQTVSSVCGKLEELDLQSCMQLKQGELSHVSKLTNLKRLNLYSVRVNTELLATIGKCEKLEHLNLGAAVVPVMHDNEEDLSTHLSRCLAKLKNLISLDLWRCKFVTHSTIETIADNCPNLEELDVGWSYVLRRHSYSEFDLIPNLCSKCTKLRKLFLTSGRSILDSDLEALANFCPDLEQLDVLGTNNVTKEGAEAVCKKCPRMFFFDLSFCGRLDDEVVSYLKRTYPHVNFKKSFQ